MISLHTDFMKFGKGFRNKRPFPMWGKRNDRTNGTRGFMRSQPLHPRVRGVPWLNETSRGHGPEIIDGGGKLVEPGRRGGVGTRHTQGFPLVVVVRKQVFRKQYKELEWFITLLRLYLSATIWRCCRCRIHDTAPIYPQVLEAGSRVARISQGDHLNSIFLLIISLVRFLFKGG